MEGNKDIQKWFRWFKLIINEYENCSVNIIELINEKNRLNRNTEKQNGDDIGFYNSIISDCIFFLKKSIEIRRLKFKNDLNKLDSFFGKNRSNILDLSMNSFKNILEEYHSRLLIENTTELMWIKDDYIVSLNDWKNDIEFILNYHYYIVKSFSRTIDNELNFFKNKGQIKLLNEFESKDEISDMVEKALVDSDEEKN